MFVQLKKKCFPEFTVVEASKKENWVKFKEAVGFIKAIFLFSKKCSECYPKGIRLENTARKK